MCFGASSVAVDEDDDEEEDATSGSSLASKEVQKVPIFCIIEQCLKRDTSTCFDVAHMC